ncbi:hypothetical protein [uncultured Spirosoma sp.]|uniref:hypothetical protein n=1 Tax=uncultured Spirosoma sp. TaxID=278208 RepID=UPI00258597BB|nr:hypothetical protein [uncultured Spirosoma sp.]
MHTKPFLVFLILFAYSFVCFGQNQKVSVKIDSIRNYLDHNNFAHSAATVLEKVLNSDEFRNRVLTGKFIRTNGMSNQELYDLIIKAHEIHGKGGKDNVVDLRLRTLTLEEDGAGWLKSCEIGSPDGTIGVDGGGSGICAICPQRLELWVDEKNIPELAGHYAHEYMHILGFSHERSFITQGRRWREKTFVYKIGNIVSELASEYQR